MEPDVMVDPLLTTNDVAEIVRVTPQTVLEWRAAGKGPKWIRLGDRLIRYQLADVKAWIGSQDGAS